MENPDEKNLSFRHRDPLNLSFLILTTRLKILVAHIACCLEEDEIHLESFHYYCVVFYADGVPLPRKRR